MNDRLEAFRKRLRGPEKTKSNWQFWIGSPTAWLALFLSATTGFYTFLYNSDELSVVIAGGGVAASDDEKDYGVRAPRSVTLINTGSRPIAVLRIQMIVAERLQGAAPATCEAHWKEQVYDLDFEHTVIKPYDVVVKAMKFEGANSPLELRDFPTPKKGVIPYYAEVVFCMGFDLVATDTWVRKTIEREHAILNTGGWSSYGSKFDPVYLIKRNRFRTEVDAGRPRWWD